VRVSPGQILVTAGTSPALMLLFSAILEPGDEVIITADHGCDPTWRGSDHTRERVPILAFGPDVIARSIGVRATFADIGESIATHLQLPRGRHGRSFL